MSSRRLTCPGSPVAGFQDHFAGHLDRLERVPRPRGGEAGALQRGTRMVLIDVYPPRMTVKPARQSPVAARPTRRRNRYRDAALRGWRRPGRRSRASREGVGCGTPARWAISVALSCPRVPSSRPDVGAGWRGRRWSGRRRTAQPLRGCCTRRCAPRTPGVIPARGST